MGDHTQAVDVDPRELEHARKTWDSFACGAKYAILAIAAVLVFLALTFIHFT
ncbi:MAG: aa3-type cytochrome c oxidase subunit IV [Alphaproteobacteria bacterium]|nr:aa3-type cytochrome c oxidase subunit IV [Alphaproteobacteria bacterium]MCB1839318.1 aa3-type cytochrome c oxidase subunit IV [Alphaproteobacteria bacterium]